MQVKVHILTDEPGVRRRVAMLTFRSANPVFLNDIQLAEFERWVNEVMGRRDDCEC